MTIARDRRRGHRAPYVLGDTPVEDILAGVVRATKRESQRGESGLFSGARRARAIWTRGVPGQAMHDQDYSIRAWHLREEPSQAHLTHVRVLYHSPKKPSPRFRGGFDEGDDRRHDRPE